MKARAILLGAAAGLTAQVTYERIAAARSEPDSWLTYSAITPGTGTPRWRRSIAVT